MNKTTRMILAKDDKDLLECYSYLNLLFPDYYEEQSNIPQFPTISYSETSMDLPLHISLHCVSGHLFAEPSPFHMEIEKHFYDMVNSQ